jgi:putative membrane protein
VGWWMILIHVGTEHAVAPLWADWTADPSAIIGITLGTFLYTRGLLASSGSRRRLHPWWRPALFYTAMAIVALALLSPLDTLSDELFAIHMVQHLLLILAVPPLILLSAPMIPMLRGVPRRLRKLIVAPIAQDPSVRWLLRTATLPIVAWLVYAASFFGWHTPGLYDAALRNEAVHILEHIMFSATAFLFWWNIIDPIPMKGNLPYLGRVPYVFITSVPNFILGAFLVYATSPWYEFYQSQALRFSLSPIDDQQLGGLIMWVPGAFVLLFTLIGVLAVMVVKEERQQRELEVSTTAQS